jgi:hypothetical protein
VSFSSQRVKSSATFTVAMQVRASADHASVLQRSDTTRRIAALLSSGPSAIRPTMRAAATSQVGAGGGSGGPLWPHANSTIVERMRVIALWVVLAVTVARADDKCKPGVFDAHVDDGWKALKAGYPQAALVHFEAALVCRDEYDIVRWAFTAACMAKNLPHAKIHYKDLRDSDKNRLAELCSRFGIDPRP